MNSDVNHCIIDKIIAKEVPAYMVYEDEGFIAFLDHRPLFPGHTLLSPKCHIGTLMDLPDEMIQPFFYLTKQLTKAVQIAMEATGVFVAMNNIVSQSIPHLHTHIVPRNKRDGLKGFFWPRVSYLDEEHLLNTQRSIKKQIDKFTMVK
jgi:histidine triad (HIT) family protein